MAAIKGNKNTHEMLKHCKTANMNQKGPENGQTTGIWSVRVLKMNHNFDLFGST